MSGTLQQSIFMLAYTPAQLAYSTGGPKDVSLLYSEQLIKDDFINMEWIKLEARVTEIFEGTGHTALSSVLDGVGFRR